MCSIGYDKCQKSSISSIARMHKFENKEVKVVVATTQIPQITHLRDFHFLC